MDDRYEGPERREGERRRVKWTDDVLDIRFDHVDSVLETLSPLPLEMAKMLVREERSVNDFEEIKRGLSSLESGFHDLKSEVISARKVYGFVAFLIPVAVAIVALVLK